MTAQEIIKILGGWEGYLNVNAGYAALHLYERREFARLMVGIQHNGGLPVKVRCKRDLASLVGDERSALI